MTQATSRTYRIGQIVPSSNTTMETEIPGDAARARKHPAGALHVPFEPHAHEERRQGRAGGDGCAKSDAARPNSPMRASMCSATRASSRSWRWGRAITAVERACDASHAENGGEAPVMTRAGALVARLKAMGARVALMAPYMKPLTEPSSLISRKKASKYWIDCRGRDSRQPRSRSPRSAATARRCRRIISKCRCGRAVGLRADAVARRDPDRAGQARRAGHVHGRLHGAADARSSRPRADRSERRSAARRDRASFHGMLRKTS